MTEKTGGGVDMAGLGVLVAALGVYLVYALINPEKL